MFLIENSGSLPLIVLFENCCSCPPELAEPGVPVERIVEFRVSAGQMGEGDFEQLVEQEVAHLGSEAWRRLQRTRADGMVLEEIYRPLDGGGLLATITDITEGARARQALIASDKYLREIIEGVPVAVFVIDRRHQITHWNQACAALTGYSAEQMIGSTEQWRAFYGSERPVMADLIVDSASDEETAQHYGDKYRRSALLEGAYVAEDFFPEFGPSNQWVFFTAAPLRNHSGEIVGAIETLQDITERKRVSDELHEANLKLEHRVAGRTQELQESNQQLEDTLAELQSAQAFMVQSEKMVSIGQLAAGVAHEINNPTGFVASNLNSLRDYVADIVRLIGEYRQFTTSVGDLQLSSTYSKQLERIKEIEQEVELEYLLEDLESLVDESREGTDRIRKIVKALKDFAHPGEGTMQFADINDLIETTLNVVNNEIKYKATVEKSLSDLPHVKCLAQELNQVFVNLLVNAAQAIDEKRSISILSRPVDDQWVEIIVRDTGSGIPEDNLKKIFDPFFTTKEVGKGTGLGLNVVYSIVAKHNGSVDVDSRLGEGTAFTIKLPVDPALVSSDDFAESVAGGSLSS